MARFAALGAVGKIRQVTVIFPLEKITRHIMSFNLPTRSGKLKRRQKGELQHRQLSLFQVDR